MKLYERGGIIEDPLCVCVPAPDYVPVAIRLLQLSLVCVHDVVVPSLGGDNQGLAFAVLEEISFSNYPLLCLSRHNIPQ